jgi:2,5-diketo-D-gluconate reductase A
MRKHHDEKHHTDYHDEEMGDMAEAHIPSFTMNNGAEIPAQGFGTFMMSGDEVRKTLPSVFDLGIRHIDTAEAYRNEVAVGQAVKASGIDRDKLFITTKLFPQDYGTDVTMKAVDACLRRLDMDYIDLMLLHQPYGKYTEAWEVLSKAVEQGKIRSIGLSNFNRAKTQQILDLGGVVPQVMQVEINPRWNQHELKEWLQPKGVVFEAWYPLGHGDRSLLNRPVFTKLAKKYGKSNAQIILRWEFQEGDVTLPKSLNPAHIAQNIDIFDFQLTDDEMAEINQIPQSPYYHVPEQTPGFVSVHQDFDQQV